MNAEREEHPSFGAISFTRVSSSHAIPMYGSSIKHSHYLQMEITESSMARELSNDWRLSGKILLRARMSSTQFADALTGLNQGGGHPLTLEYVSGDGTPRPDPPFTNKGEQFKAETEEFFVSLKTLMDNLVKQANDIADRPRTTAARTLVKAVGHLQQHITSNMDFLHEQFMRQMQRTVLEAKQEIDTHASHVITETGLKALREGVSASMGDPPKMLEGTP